jgi:hypothetical protein
MPVTPFDGLLHSLTPARSPNRSGAIQLATPTDRYPTRRRARHHPHQMISAHRGTPVQRHVGHTHPAENIERYSLRQTGQRSRVPPAFTEGDPFRRNGIPRTTRRRPSRSCRRPLATAGVRRIREALEARGRLPQIIARRFERLATVVVFWKRLARGRTRTSRSRRRARSPPRQYPRTAGTARRIEHLADRHAQHELPPCAASRRLRRLPGGP